MNRIRVIVLMVIGGGIVLGIQSLMRDQAQKERRELVAEKRTTRGQLSKREIVGRDKLMVGVGEEAVAACFEEVLALIERGEAGLFASEERVRYRAVLFQIREFSPEDVASFFGLLGSKDSFVDIPDFEKSVVDEFILAAAPWSALLYLKENREGEYWADYFREAFSKSLQAEPLKTLRLYEKARGTGDPDFQKSWIRSPVLMHLATEDPRQMLEYLSKEEFHSDPETVMHLGGFVVSRLEGVDQYVNFLLALDEAIQKWPEEEVYAAVRRDLVAEFKNEIGYLEFEEAMKLVDQVLSLEEQMLVLSQFSHLGGLTSPEKWAHRIQQLKVSDWEEWSARQPGTPRHPFVGVMTSWVWDDVEAADEFMQTVPTGELRNLALPDFVYRLASKDATKATRYLEELPEGEEQTRRIRSTIEHNLREH